MGLLGQHAPGHPARPPPNPPTNAPQPQGQGTLGAYELEMIGILVERILDRRPNPLDHPVLVHSLQAITDNQHTNQGLQGWKLHMLGYFYPDADISQYGGGDLFYVSTDVHYRSVVLFLEAIRDAATTPARIQTLRTNLHLQFKGRAQSWYNTLAPQQGR
ncbi:hypothetical protein QBC47DRAFT_404373 [Echria macrotheca]|uniref:Uncharacterized protein n=1 Tax=Echria macrotheca TaxID=438768 RepID=A0AAJ0B868_9PEZI|nr:hypothetical protein QBC47DRAFT_404373 [Echria macrotheca]